MLDSSSILLLFDTVLHKDIARFGISRLDIRRGVQNMAHIYAPRPSNLTFTTVDVANYNDVAHRCAYLHKFAAFHTAMVQDVMIIILEKKCPLFRTLTSSKDFRICSLGGGPGSDVIGVIAALNTLFNTFKVHVTIVDLMEQWESTFSSMLAELSYGNYGILRTNVAENFLRWNYIGANLLDSMTVSVRRAISKASLITLIKFVSAAACKDTKEMIKRILQTMKPGALLLFIDNAAGGFHELIYNTAKNYNFVTVFGPLRHYNYCNENLKTEKFGYTSCFTTTVTVLLLQKPLNQHFRSFQDDMSDSSEEDNDNITENVPFIAKAPSEKKIYPQSKSSLFRSTPSVLSKNVSLPGCVNKAAIPVKSNFPNSYISNDVAGASNFVNAKKIKQESNLIVSKNKPNLFQSTHLIHSNNESNPVSSNQQSTNISRVAMHSQKIVNKAKLEPQSNLLPSNRNQKSTTIPYAGILTENIPDKIKVKPLSDLSSSQNNQQSTTISSVAALSQTAVSRKNMNPTSGLSSSHNSSRSFPNSNVPQCIEQPSTTRNINNPNKSNNTSNINPLKNNNLPPNRKKTKNSATITKYNRSISPSESNNGRSIAVPPRNSNRTNTALPPQRQSNALPDMEENPEACCSCCVLS